jgi:hypothetical protein
MKFWKHTLISTLAFIGVSSTVLYTACEKDSCLALKCRNGAVCVDGFCQCLEGFEGSECTLWASARFTGRYYGSTIIDNQSYKIDSAVVESIASPDVVSFYFAADEKKRYEGRVNGHYLKLTDPNTGEYFELVEDQERITVYIEKTVDGKKTITNFDGVAAR